MTSLLPIFASAAQVTDRSIALTSSSASATSVTYTVNFTSAAAAGAFVVDFCSNSPVIGDTCTAPTGFDASSAASTTSGFTDVTGATSQFVVAGTVGATTAITVDVTGIDNPTVSGPLYARIVTYDTKAHALLYSSTDPTDGSTITPIDQGGIAMQINDTVGVSGVVMETMTFCVAGGVISQDCNLTSNTAPILKLGETVGSTKALISTAISTGTIYTQISTNARTGAIISIKSNAAGCGGLLLAGDPTHCYIQPALTGGITAGQAKFGVKTGTAVATVGDSDANGTLEPVSASGYNASTYALNYISGDATGVTSIYGDPFLDTASGPINNMNMPITFGASVNNSTPAGTYSADLGMVATGKF